MGFVDLSAAQRQELDRQQTVSDKIRLLDRLGYARADIARILDKRYQHVRNVLEQDRAKHEQHHQEQQKQSISGPLSFHRLSVNAGGSVSLPEPLIRALGLSTDRAVIAREVDGEVHLMSPATAVARAQALLDPQIYGERRLLSDELLADRRAEVDRDRSH